MRAATSFIRSKYFLLLASIGVALLVITPLLASALRTTLVTTITSDLALALIVTSFVSFIFDHHVERDLLRSVGDAVTKEIEGSRSLTASGITKVYENPSRALASYPELVHRSRHHIEILTAVSAPFFWNPDFESATLYALQRGVRLRVLLLEPNASVLKLLSRQEGRSADDYSDELRLTLRKWRELEDTAKRRKLTGAIEVRTYDDLPTAFFFIVDDLMFFAPYLHSSYRMSTPCIEATTNGFLSNSFKDHFESMWGLSSDSFVMEDSHGSRYAPN
jgi:hypothetical protein